MANRAKAKGDRAELEVQAMLRDQLGVPARRALGAGRKDDVGDIVGLDDVVVQVVNYVDLARAVREKLPDLERQKANAGADFAALFCRRPGGKWVVCMSVETFCAFWRESR